MLNNFASQVFYQQSVNLSFADAEKDLLIIDKAVLPFFKPALSSWKNIYEVTGGEKLKEWKTAAEHIDTLTRTWGHSASRNSRVVVCGGGSVGDFGGFFASILKRGVQLVHVPTTWLSAIDSAHGGKTALNVGGVKNQLGTFYPAQSVYIFQDILFKQDSERSIDGFGECLKMMMLETSSVQEKAFKNANHDLNQFLWDNLKTAIQRKYEIVSEDPYEKLGRRKLLNLGHTFGHALEAATAKSHGFCVLQGLVFSLRWSCSRELLHKSFLETVLNFVRQQDCPIWDEAGDHYTFKQDELKSLLLADKKSVGKNVLDFVFVKSAGDVVCEKVTVDELISESKRQGWVK